MTQNHRDYFLARAAEERKKATEAASKAVAAIHLEMAEKYENHVASMAEAPRERQSA